MSCKPILFNGEMVQAILDGRKTQTRRVVKLQPPDGAWPIYDALDCYEGEGWAFQFAEQAVEFSDCFNSGHRITHNVIFPLPNKGRCPYGVPGDKLWIRTAYRVAYDESRDVATWTAPGMYVQTHGRPHRKDGLPMKLGGKPAIHMPYWLSAEAYPPLLVEDVRVEWVAEISEEDVAAEGTPGIIGGKYGCRNCNNAGWTHSYPNGCPGCNGTGVNASQHFHALWDSINATPKLCSGRGVHALLDTPYYVSYPREDIHETREHRGLPWFVLGNPRVWAVTFRRINA